MKEKLDFILILSQSNHATLAYLQVFNIATSDFYSGEILICLTECNSYNELLNYFKKNFMHIEFKDTLDGKLSFNIADRNFAIKKFVLKNTAYANVLLCEVSVNDMFTMLELQKVSVKNLNERLEKLEKILMHDELSVEI